MDTAPKEAIPVRPRFRPIDYITGKVPAIDSEEYQKILKEEEDVRKKAVEDAESRRKQQQSANAVINSAVEKLSLELGTDRPRRQRNKNYTHRFAADEEFGPAPKMKKKSRLNFGSVDDDSDDDAPASFVASNFSTDDNNEEEEDECEDSDDTDEDEFMDVSDDDSENIEDGRVMYEIDERLLEYVLSARRQDGEGGTIDLSEESEDDDDEDSPESSQQKDGESNVPESPREKYDLSDVAGSSQEKEFVPESTPFDILRSEQLDLLPEESPADDSPCDEATRLSQDDVLTDVGPKDHSFGIKSLKNGDIVYVDRRERGENVRKSMILLAYHEFNAEHEVFQGRQVILNPDAKERLGSNPDSVSSVFLVHYLNSDRRLDEWIDCYEIHSLVERSVETLDEDGNSKVDDTKTRSDRKLGDEFTSGAANGESGATQARCEENLEKVTMVRNIDTIEFGPNAVGCWYFSPFPPNIVVTRNLYMCEHCLWYCSYPDFYALHKKECEQKEPPGPVIYQVDEFAVYEVNGNDNYRYCQSLCLLSKLFLDHKTIFYAIKTFYFYVLAEIDEEGNRHVAGFFSKENFSMNNLACIMILPPFQRKGYGKFLIQLSYTLSARENFIGSPEKPLSDLGKVSYRSIWWFVLINTLEALHVEEDIPVSELSMCTGIHEDDIISTFESQQLIKKWKDGIYIVFNDQVLAYCKSLSMFQAPKLFLDVDKITWTERYELADPSEEDEDDVDDEESEEEDEEEDEDDTEARKAQMEIIRNYEALKRKRELFHFKEHKGFGDGCIGCLDSSDDEVEQEGDYIDYNKLLANLPSIDQL